MNADWSSRAACPSRPSGGEHLVPVVADPTAGPAVPAAARQTHRVGVGRAEERFGRGGAPVDQQPTARAVGETESSDVDRLRASSAPTIGPGTGRGRTGAGRAVERSAGGSPGRAPAPRGHGGRVPCARHRGGRTGRRSTARGFARSPRSAARRRRSAPGRPWRRGGREGRTRWWSGLFLRMS